MTTVESVIYAFNGFSMNLTALKYHGQIVIQKKRLQSNKKISPTSFYSALNLRSKTYLGENRWLKIIQHFLLLKATLHRRGGVEVVLAGLAGSAPVVCSRQVSSRLNLIGDTK